MTDEREDDRELGEGERELAGLLSDRRPLPPAGFRGALARQLAADDPGFGPRPQRLRLVVAASCGGGSLLIALGALVAVAL